MNGYLVALWTALAALLPVLIVFASLVLVGLVLDANSTDGEW